MFFWRFLPFLGQKSLVRYHILRNLKFPKKRLPYEEEEMIMFGRKGFLIFVLVVEKSLNYSGKITFFSHFFEQYLGSLFQKLAKKAF